MGFFSSFRDFVLGVDQNAAAAHTSAGSQQHQRQPRHVPSASGSKRTRTNGAGNDREQHDAVAGTAVGGELPRGPGILEELQAGTSGGIQVGSFPQASVAAIAVMRQAPRSTTCYYGKLSADPKCVLQSYTPHTSRSWPPVGPQLGVGACHCALCRIVCYNFVSPVTMFLVSSERA